MTSEAPPRYVHVPPRDGSLAAAAVGVGGKLGRSFDPAQRQAIDVLTSAWSNGKPATLESAIICPRQNLKTYVLEAIALTRLLHPRTPDKLVVWSAHEVATAQETFNAILDLADRHPWLGKQIAGTGRSPGREYLRFSNGARLRFRARIKTGGRGLAGDLIVLDEAFALQPEHMGSLLPILSTRPRGKVIYGSSAPQPTSDVLRKVMDRGRAGGAAAPAYIEWCAPGSLEDPGCDLGASCRHDLGTPGCVMDDERLWAVANPGHVYGRISIDYLRSERMALTPSEFGRERLGWSDAPATADAPPLTAAEWADRADPASRIDGPIVIGIDVTPDRSAASIAVAGRREDGKAHVELAHSRGGTDWVAGEVARMLTEHQVLDLLVGTGEEAVMTPAVVGDEVAIGSMKETFEAVDVRPIQMKTSEVARSCTRLLDAVRADEVRHTGQIQISTALAAASRRDVGDGGWAWGKRKSSGVDISGLVAITNAHDALCRAIENEVWGFWD